MISLPSSSRSISVVLLALTVSGCAFTGTKPDFDAVPELSSVPFFPQTEFDCGPAALATILNWEGVSVGPDDLIDAVYIEGLQGSLQVELLAATRRYGLLPVPVQSDADELLAEVRSGRPVLVMQNLGFSRAPRWHYAVVVGYSADDGRVILRSGEQERRRERTSRFLRSWRLAENWGFVAVQPGEIPATAEPDTYMRALVGALEQLPNTSVALAYEAAVERWPNDPFVLFLAASREHALDRQQPAAALYRRLIEIDPEHAAARNNLANIYLERGCLEEAASEAAQALELQSPDGEFLAAINETLTDIRSAASNADGECLLAL